MIQDSILIFSKIDKYVSIIEAVVLIFTTFLLSIFEIGWMVKVIRNLKLDVKSKRRLVGNPISRYDVENCRRKITQGKLLLLIISLEFISSFSYFFGFIYPQLSRVIPHLNRTSLPFNTTCIAQIKEHRIWIKELEYPIVGLLLTTGRVGLILSLGVAISFFQFITNTHVNDTWKIKHIYRCIWYTGFLSLALFILGAVPYTMLIGRILIVIAFGIYYIRVVRQILVLKKAMKWREQDLYHNCQIELLKAHKKQQRYFAIAYKCVGVGILLYGLGDALQMIEMVTSTFLYYGECIFPLLFHLHYHPLLTTNQLPYLDLALILFADVEKIIITSATIIIAFPFMVLTILLIVAKKRTVFRYKVYDPNLQCSLK